VPARPTHCAAAIATTVSECKTTSSTTASRPTDRDGGHLTDDDAAAGAGSRRQQQHQERTLGRARTWGVRRDSNDWSSGAEQPRSSSSSDASGERQRQRQQGGRRSAQSSRDDSSASGEVSAVCSLLSPSLPLKEAPARLSLSLCRGEIKPCCSPCSALCCTYLLSPNPRVVPSDRLRPLCGGELYVSASAGAAPNRVRAGPASGLGPRRSVAGTFADGGGRWAASRAPYLRRYALRSRGSRWACRWGSPGSRRCALGYPSVCSIDGRSRTNRHLLGCAVVVAMKPLAVVVARAWQSSCGIADAPRARSEPELRANVESRSKHDEESRPVLVFIL